MSTTTPTQQKNNSCNLDDYLPLVTKFKDEAFFTMQNYLEVQSKPTVTHFKLRLPTFAKTEFFSKDEYSPEHHLDNAIYRFISLIEEHIPLLSYGHTANKQQIPSNPIGYIWLKEQSSENNIVYHILLLTSRDMQFYMGNEATKVGAIRNHITRHWCDAVKLDIKDFNWLVTQCGFSKKNYSQNQWSSQVINAVDYLTNIVLSMTQYYPSAWEDGLQFFGSNAAQQRYY